MSIVITYEGRLDRSDRIEYAIGFLEDQCRKIQWHCTRVCEETSGLLIVRKQGQPARLRMLNQTLRGITLHPPGTGPMRFLFDREGRLRNYTPFPPGIIPNPVEGERYYVEGRPSIITTGQIETHAWVVLLLRAFRARFMARMRVDDETGYFKSMDAMRLIEAHDQMGHWISLFRDPALPANVVSIHGPARGRPMPSVRHG